MFGVPHCVRDDRIRMWVSELVHMVRLFWIRLGMAWGSVAALGFAEDGGEVTAAEGEALLDASGDR
jgi:hypothetical protein